MISEQTDKMHFGQRYDKYYDWRRWTEGAQGRVEDVRKLLAELRSILNKEEVASVEAFIDEIQQEADSISSTPKFENNKADMKRIRERTLSLTAKIESPENWGTTKLYNLAREKDFNFGN